MIWTLPPSAWPMVVAVLEEAGEPWPEELARADLAFMHAELLVGLRARPPGRPMLSARWRWTPHQVRQLLDTSPAPARRQDETGTIRTGAPSQAIGELAVTSGTPAQRQEAAGPHLEAVELHWGSPAQRQPGASPTTEIPGLSGEYRQPSASPAPAAIAVVPPHTPPPDLSFLSTSGEDRSIGEGVKGEGATMPAALEARRRASPEGQRFLEIWTKWRHHPKAPARWTGGPAEALAWFLELMESGPDTTMGPIIAALDVSASLEAWDVWLGDRADLAGRAGPEKRARFPSGWKNALRTWLTNQVRFGRNLKPAKPTRRGAWRGQATVLTPTAPGLTSPAETCTGDPDALDKF